MFKAVGLENCCKGCTPSLLVINAQNILKSFSLENVQLSTHVFFLKRQLSTHDN